jgi:ATP-binding cassette, subfamily C, bacterial CydD
MSDHSRLFQLGALVKGSLALSVTAGFAAGLLAVLHAMQLAHIITAVFLEGQGLDYLQQDLALLLLFICVRSLALYISENTAGAAAVRLKMLLRERLLNRLASNSPLLPGQPRGENLRTGQITNTLTQDIESLDAYFSQYLPQLALAAMLPAAYLLIILPVDLLSALVLALTGPLIPLFMFLIGAHARSLTQKQWKTLSRMSAYFLDTLQGLTTLKIFGRSREQIQKTARVAEQYRLATMQVLRITFLSALALELLSTLGTAVIAVEVGLRLLYGRIGFEQAFFILLLAPEFYLPLRNLGLRFHASMAGLDAAKSIFKLLNAPHAPSQPSSVAAFISTPPPPYEIAFNGVSYSYPGAPVSALADVSFTLRPSEVAALVGPSGSGKTTLCRLLLRFGEPQQGQILVNGLPLSNFKPGAWREQIAWVPQQPVMFYGTLADNLRLAVPDAPLEALRCAAKQAHLSDWIESLPAGFDTFIGEGGARLSGGQAQRLALARAYLRPAPLVIFDEPAAHLDVENEQLFQSALNQLAANRTVLVIAHRLPTAARAGQVLALNHGRLVEHGTHEDLLTQNGLYAHLLQAYNGGQPA